MNKRLFSLLLTSALVLSVPALPASALTAADTEDLTAFDPYSDEALHNTYYLIDKDVYDGTWTETGYGFDLYLPLNWRTVELTDELAAAGLVFALKDPDEKWALSLFRTPSEKTGGLVLEAVYEELAAAPDTYSRLSYETVNSIHTLVYENTADNTWGVLFFDADGNLYSLIFSPADDEEFKPYRQNIFLSIMPTETAETDDPQEED